MPMPLTMVRHLRDLVGWEQALTIDSHGNVSSYAALKNVKGRIESKVMRVTAHDGREAVSKSRVVLQDVAVDGTPVSIGVRDRITLPSPHVPTQPPILNFDQDNHDHGVYAWVLIL